MQSNKGASSDHSSIAKKPTSGLKPGYNNSCNSGAGSRHEGGGGALSSGLSDRSGLGKFGHSGHSSSGQVKRSPSFSTSAPAAHGPPTKKHKMASLRDVSLAEAGKYGSLNDYAFFDKVSLEEVTFLLVKLGNALCSNFFTGENFGRNLSFHSGVRLGEVL